MSLPKAGERERAGRGRGLPRGAGASRKALVLCGVDGISSQSGDDDCAPDLGRRRIAVQHPKGAFIKNVNRLLTSSACIWCLMEALNPASNCSNYLCFIGQPLPLSEDVLYGSPLIRDREQPAI